MGHLSGGRGSFGFRCRNEEWRQREGTDEPDNEDRGGGDGCAGACLRSRSARAASGSRCRIERGWDENRLCGADGSFESNERCGKFWQGVGREQRLQHGIRPVERFGRGELDGWKFRVGRRRGELDGRSGRLWGRQRAGWHRECRTGCAFGLQSARGRGRIFMGRVSPCVWIGREDGAGAPFVAERYSAGKLFGIWPLATGHESGSCRTFAGFWEWGMGQRARGGKEVARPQHAAARQRIFRSALIFAGGRFWSAQGGQHGERLRQQQKGKELAFRRTEPRFSSEGSCGH